MTIEHDCIVVGAGIAGCSLAFTLANQGRRVLLFERDLSEPDRIVGELLQPGGVNVLRKLGMGDCLQNMDAIVNEGYGVFNGPRQVHLAYPDRLDGQDGKEISVSFHHGRFVMNLRQKCLNHKNIDVLEMTVNELLTEEEAVIGVECTEKVGEDRLKRQFYAPLTIVADGCFSKFRKEISHKPVVIRSHFVGAILHDCDLPMPNNGHVLLADPSPILLYQLSTHDTRILVDIPGKLPSASNGELSKYMLTKVMPQLPASVRPSFQQAITTQRLRVMPNSFLPAICNERRGLIVLGDALNMRHPLTGGGMTVAFKDVHLLSQLLHPDQIATFHNSTPQIELIMQQFHVERKRHCMVINILAQALYDLFSGGNQDLVELRNACFDYFVLGGRCARDPIGLLAGLIENPLILFAHFFAVAFLSMYNLLTKPLTLFQHRLLQPFHHQITTQQHTPSVYLLFPLYYIIWTLCFILSFPWNIYICIRVLTTACMVLFPLIWTELSF